MDKDFKVIKPDWSRIWPASYEVADASMVDPEDATRVIQFGNFMVDTAVFDSATLTTLGQPFMIDAVNFAPGPNPRGIPTLWASWPDVLVGYVVKAPASNRIVLATVCF